MYHSGFYDRTDSDVDPEFYPYLKSKGFLGLD